VFFVAAGSLCMMNGPKCVESGDSQETVASILVAVLVLGIGKLVRLL
jgi:hypothetical protein